MEYTIPIPDDVAKKVQDRWEDIPGRVLESFALAAYNDGIITEYEIQKILGNLRIMLTQRAADNSTVDAGTLIVPANQASNFVNGLANSLKELDSKLKEAREQQQTEGQTQQ